MNSSFLNMSSTVHLTML